MRHRHVIHLITELAKAVGRPFVTCEHPSCDGLGKWPDGADCSMCHGTRLVLEPLADKEEHEEKP